MFTKTIGFIGGGRVTRIVRQGFQHAGRMPAKAMIGGRLSPAEVVDLIPVNPLSEFEEAITGMYREKLIALYEKLKS